MNNIKTKGEIWQKLIISAAKDTKVIITCEEHQVGGFGNIVAGAIATSKDMDSPLVMDMVGINDRFGESGQSCKLMTVFGLTG